MKKKQQEQQKNEEDFVKAIKHGGLAPLGREILPVLLGEPRILRTSIRGSTVGRLPTRFESHKWQRLRDIQVFQAIFSLVG